MPSDLLAWVFVALTSLERPDGRARAQVEAAKHLLTDRRGPVLAQVLTDVTAIGPLERSGDIKFTPQPVQQPGSRLPGGLSLPRPGPCPWRRPTSRICSPPSGFCSSSTA
jgi:hypothetical protein